MEKLSTKLVILSFLFITFSCKTTKIDSSTVQIKADRTEITAGETAVISWDVQTGMVTIPDVGVNLAKTGTFNVSPKQDTTIKLFVTDKKGNVLTKSVSVKVKPKNTALPDIRLELNPKEIDSNSPPSELSWHISNLQPGDEVFLDYKIAGNPFLISVKDTIGTKSVQLIDEDAPLNDPQFILYSMKVKRENTEIARSFVSGNYKKQVSIVPPIGFSEGQNDGRFTIGGNGVRLMYGYPVPQSTSHFVANIDGHFATNTPGLENTQYISSIDKVSGKKGSPFIETEFHFNGVKITQKLTPVDKDYKTVKQNTFGQLYKIEYIFENTTEKNKKVGLTTILDFMIDNNDAAHVEVNGVRVSNETGYKGNDVPDAVKAYCEYGAEAKGTAWTVMNKGDAVKPDEYYIGRWPYLYDVTYEVTPDHKPFGDSGELLKWNSQTLKPGDKRTVSYYYGFPYEAQIAAMTHQKVEERNITIYFSKGNSVISKDDERTIKKLISDNSDKQILGVLVSGYGDATGTDEANFKVSKKRAQNVASYLSRLNIEKQAIIQKAYGETMSLQTEDALKKGNDNDRKCEIIIYLKDNN